MEDDDEYSHGSFIGRPKVKKGENPMNQPARDRALRQRQGLGDIPIQQVQNLPPQSKIPDFGDGSRIVRDWILTGLIDKPMEQYEVVFTRLLEFSYNKDKPINQRRILSYLDLANHIKSITKSANFSFRNLNIPIRYIRDHGLYIGDKISGQGMKTKGDFAQNQNATRQIIYDTLERTPLGIVIENFPAFEKVGMGIYQVPFVACGEKEEHSLLVIAKGIIEEADVEFLVVQNSWGEGFGNNGYCRLFLPENGEFKIYWPL